MNNLLRNIFLITVTLMLISFFLPVHPIVLVVAIATAGLASLLYGAEALFFPNTFHK